MGAPLAGPGGTGGGGALGPGRRGAGGVLVGNPQSAQVCLLPPRTGPGGGGWAERTEPGPAQSHVCEWHRVSPVERQVEGGAPGQCRLQPRPQGLLGQQQDSPAVSLQAAVRVAACRWEVVGTRGMGWGCAVGTALLGWCHCHGLCLSPPGSGLEVTFIRALATHWGRGAACAGSGPLSRRPVLQTCGAHPHPARLLLRQGDAGVRPGWGLGGEQARRGWALTEAVISPPCFLFPALTAQSTKGDWAPEALETPSPAQDVSSGVGA